MSEVHMDSSVVLSEPNKKGEIKAIIEDLLSKIQIPYTVTPYAEGFHNLCCRLAIERGYPMGTDRSVPSLLPFINIGVVLASTAYAHIEDEERHIFVCFYTAFLTYVDDACAKETENERVSVFIERFIHGEKQFDAVLDCLANFLQSIPDYFEPVVANIILVGALNMINSTVLDCATQRMKPSLCAKKYPMFTRLLSGANEAFSLMMFPRSIPMQNYIQCIPYTAVYVAYVNDVLSFYKEELAHETVNFLSVFARCHGISKMKAFKQAANDAAEADAQVCKILLEVDQGAYRAWQKFKEGYVGFHTSFERYRLHELMSQVGSEPALTCNAE